jgi:hypothetical protein
MAFLVSVPSVCEVDFVLMRSEEVLFVEGFFEAARSIKCANEWQSFY